jgi:hypothetical protein
MLNLSCLLETKLSSQNDKNAPTFRSVDFVQTVMGFHKCCIPAHVDGGWLSDIHVKRLPCIHRCVLLASHAMPASDLVFIQDNQSKGLRFLPSFRAV